MNADDFTFIAQTLKERSGLVLTTEKTYLLESRLAPVARNWNVESVDKLIGLLRRTNDQTLLREIVEAMTTNESFFFRDQKPFDHFRTLLLPRLLEARAGRKHLRIWSAAASSGQEAYSLAMICSEERARLAGWRVEIVGTDLSTEMIARARSGIYSQFEVQRGLPVTMLVKYFDQIDSDKWQIKQPLRDMVTYKFANLLEPFGGLGTFDVIYCRNVLIYFDQNTKTKVLAEMTKILSPDGYLFLGGAETVVGLSTRFKPLENERGIYVLTERATTL